MSKCKKHTTDLSSTVGVCASCLRERLFVVIAAQAQKQHQLRQASLDQRHNFPRSVSPYITSRKSDASAAWQQPNGHVRHHRFFSTPQVGPTGSVTLEIREKRSKKTNKLSSLFSRIFRSKPDSSDPPRGSETTSSWLSSVFSTRRKKRGTTAFSLDEGSTAARRPTRQNNNKGLSPARCSSDDEEEEEEEEEGGDRSSGESSESSWRHRRATTPSNASATRRRTGTAASNSLNLSSGLAFCLSPLVRASPNHRNWSSELAVSGESHLPKPASFCKNRSRKLADFGRYNSYCGRSNR